MPGTTVPKTGKYIHISDPDWKKSDEEGNIRTITLSKTNGIQALYNLDKKKIFTYLFLKSKWSKEKAIAWVKDHANEGLMDESGFLETIMNFIK